MQEYIVYITLAVVLIIAIIVNRLCDEIFPIIWRIGGIIGIICGAQGVGMVSIKESILSLICIFIFTFIMLNIFIKLRNGIGGGIIKGFWMCSIFIGRYVILTIILFTIYIVIRGKTMKRDEIDKYLLSPYREQVVHIMALCVAITVVIMKLFSVV